MVSVKLNAESASWPAPVGGWNTRDPQAMMAPEDALVMKNCIPQNSNIELRNGFASHATSLGSGVVDSLAEYVKIDGTRTLIGFADNKIYDATSSGAASDITGSTTPTNNRWQTLNINNVLVMVNGAQIPQSYNGTTVSDLALTDATGTLTISDLIHVTSYSGRAYYTEKDTASVWYCAAGAHTGALLEFDFQSLFKRGGYLQFCTPWTRDAGDGVQELFVAVSSKGEVLIYSGSDPSSWNIVGRFYVPVPLGRRAFVDMGSDVVFLTEEGNIPLSSILSVGGNITTYSKLTDKINDAFTSAAAAGASNFGWEGIVYPRKHLMLFNCPKVTGDTANQFVLNTQSGSWCLFTGINANCWCLLNEEIYFGGNDGTIYKWDSGDDDNGTAISFEVKTAYNYFDDMTKKKHFKMGRMHVLSSGTPAFVFDVDVDFQDTPVTQTVQTLAGSGATWDDATWDVDEWQGEGNASAEWRTLTGLGRSAAVVVKGDFKNLGFSISSFDIIYETGSYL